MGSRLPAAEKSRRKPSTRLRISSQLLLWTVPEDPPPTHTHTHSPAQTWAARQTVLQIWTYPLINHATVRLRQNSWAAQRRNMEEVRVSKGKQEKEWGRNKNELADSATTRWPGASLFPNSFARILLGSFKRSHNCFPSFMYRMCDPCQRGSTRGHSPRGHESRRCRQRYLGMWIFQ